MASPRRAVLSRAVLSRAVLSRAVPSRALLPAAVAASVLLIGACSSDGSDTARTSSTTTTSTTVVVNQGQVGTLTPAEGAAMMASDPSVVVIDVRTPEEFAQGHIQGAHNLDLSGADFQSGLDTLDKGATYLVYCRTGSRAGMAATTMVSEGFTKVYNLGGIQAWQGAGQPVVAS